MSMISSPVSQRQKLDKPKWLFKSLETKINILKVRKEFKSWRIKIIDEWWDNVGSIFWLVFNIWRPFPEEKFYWLINKLCKSEIIFVLNLTYFLSNWNRIDFYYICSFHYAIFHIWIRKVSGSYNSLMILVFNWCRS